MSKICKDCKTNCSHIGEFYFIKTELWKSVARIDIILCIGCVEQRLGRKLDKSDFTQCYINDPKKSKGMSQRLLERLQ